MARNVSEAERDRLLRRGRVEAAMAVGRDVARKRIRAKSPGELAKLRALEIQRKVQVLKGSKIENYKRERDLARAQAPKPEKTTLYTKAGPRGVSLGDCPFSHSVQMALRLKDVDYNVVPCTAETKPAWLVEEVGGKMPCVCHDGVPHVETSDILAWIDTEFAGPSLAVPAEMTEALAGGFGLFPAIAKFTKNTDDSKDGDLRGSLTEALGRLRAHLSARQTEFLCGPDPTLADCNLLPKLYVLEHATAHYKVESPWGELAEGDAVREYFERGLGLGAFTETAYTPDVGIWGWGEARKS